MSELKPCPFCGGEAVEFTWKHDLSNSYMAVVRCDVCKVRAERGFGAEEAVKAEAIEAWNTRHERTCHVEKSVHDIYGSWHYLSCGHRVDTWIEDPPKYCSKCGARVKEDADEK